VVSVSDLDGIHLDEGEHIKLGYAVTEKVKNIIW
jgi:hypothetical protein